MTKVKVQAKTRKNSYSPTIYVHIPKEVAEESKLNVGEEVEIESLGMGRVSITK